MVLQNWLFETIEGARRAGVDMKSKDTLYIYMFSPDPTFPHQVGKKWILQTYQAYYRKKPITPFERIEPRKEAK